MDTTSVTQNSSHLERLCGDAELFNNKVNEYFLRLTNSVGLIDISQCYKLAQSLENAWKSQKRVFICGNGGSAANALHIANDLHYGTGAPNAKDSSYKPGIRVEALTANTGILTCLANDTGYENIFSTQLVVNGSEDDVLIVLSGSGNSLNVVKALETAKTLNMTTFAILAFDGGQCLNLADHAIHVETNDMQIAEDIQLLIGHICMQWLSNRKHLHADSNA